jgi:hypothetical protein
MLLTATGRRWLLPAGEPAFCINGAHSSGEPVAVQGTAWIVQRATGSSRSPPIARCTIWVRKQCRAVFGQRHFDSARHRFTFCVKEAGLFGHRSKETRLKTNHNCTPWQSAAKVKSGIVIVPVHAKHLDAKHLTTIRGQRQAYEHGLICGHWYKCRYAPRITPHRFCDIAAAKLT